MNVFSFSTGLLCIRMLFKLNFKLEIYQLNTDIYSGQDVVICKM